MKWSPRVNSGLGGGVVCLTEQTLEAGFMEAEGCGSIVKKKKPSNVNRQSTF